MNFKLYTCTILGMLSFGLQGYAGEQNPDTSFEKDPMMDGMPIDDMAMNDIPPPGFSDNKKPAPSGPDMKDEKKAAPKDKDDFGPMNDAPKEKKDMPSNPKGDDMNSQMDEMGKDMMPDLTKAPNKDAKQEQAPQDQMPLDKGLDKMPEDDFGSMGDMDDGKGFNDFGPEAPMDDFKDDFGTMDDMDEFSKMDGDMMSPDMDDKMMDKSMSEGTPKDLMPAAKEMNPKGMSDSMDADMDARMDDQIDKQPDNFKQ